MNINLSSLGINKSYIPKRSEITRSKVLIDAKDQILGKVCALVASILRGKHKPTFTPGFDMGDFVYIINSDQIKVTGKKLVQKVYYKHTGYVGNLKSETLKEKLEKDSREVIVLGVKKMLPKTTLGRNQIKLLTVFKDSEIYVGTKAKHIPKDFMKMDPSTGYEMKRGTI
jgi:large subunit ribosomal protein L13